jgi:hypothetical protein
MAKATLSRYLRTRQEASTHLTPIHILPELLFVMAGSLEVSIIDRTIKIYTQTLQLEDMFMFPRG